MVIRAPIVAFTAALLAPVGAGAQDAAPQTPTIIVGRMEERFAIPDCIPRAGDEKAREACRTITDVLRADFKFENFPLVPESLFGAIPPLRPTGPNFEDWKSIGAQKLAITRAEVTGGDLVFEGQLYAVETGQQILAKRYPIQADSARFVAHQFYDDILAAFGRRGVGRTKIAFVSDRDSVKGKRTKEVYIMDYDGFNPRRVTVNRNLNILPAWNHEGKKIAYTSYRSGTPEIMIASIYEGKGSQVTKGHQSFAPSWSPDGKKIAYYSNKAGNMDIWVSNADGGEARKITSTAASEAAPCWSPTGLEIAFTSNRSGVPQIYVTDADGLNVRRLTTVGNYNDAPAWNPSKEYSEVAYTSRIEGGFEVAVVDLTSGQVRQISQGRGSCEYPSWAPNGRHLVFACQKGSTWQIVVSDRTGSDVRTLAAGAGNNVQPDWSP